MGDTVNVQMPARPVRCTVHGPMAYRPREDDYVCDGSEFDGTRCLVIPRAEFEPYFAITDDEIVLTPPDTPRSTS